MKSTTGELPSGCGALVGSVGQTLSITNHDHRWTDSHQRVSNFPIGTDSSIQFQRAESPFAELDFRRRVFAKQSRHHHGRVVGNRFHRAHAALPFFPVVYYAQCGSVDVNGSILRTHIYFAPACAFRRAAQRAFCASPMRLRAVADGSCRGVFVHHEYGVSSQGSAAVHARGGAVPARGRCGGRTVAGGRGRCCHLNWRP